MTLRAVTQKHKNRYRNHTLLVCHISHEHVMTKAYFVMIHEFQLGRYFSTYYQNETDTLVTTKT